MNYPFYGNLKRDGFDAPERLIATVSVNAHLECRSAEQIIAEAKLN